MLVILGIKLNLVNQVARLPAVKLLALQGLISLWLSRNWCKRRELELAIYIMLPKKVVWPDRTFLRCMIDFLCCFRKKDHPIRLNSEFHLRWHDVSFSLFPGLLPTADVEVSSDAAGSLGYGAFLKGFWFVGSWAPSQQQQSITYKELSGFKTSRRPLEFRRLLDCMSPATLIITVCL